MEKEKKQLTKGRKIYNIVSTIVVALIFAFLVVIVALLLWQRNAGNDASLFGYYLYQVQTDSMTPTIGVGDVIVSKKLKNSDKLEVGDVITFIAPSGPLKGLNETHRIYSIDLDENGNIVAIKTIGDKYDGDVNKIDNWTLTRADVKAKYVKTSTFIGGIRQLITKWYGYVILIVIPMCIVMGLFIAGVVSDKVKMEKAAAEEEKQKFIEEMSDEEKKKIADEFLASQSTEDSEEGME